MFLVYILIAVMLFLFGFAVAVPIMLFVVTFMLSKLSLKEASLKKRIINSLIFGAVGGAGLCRRSGREDAYRLDLDAG